MSAAIATIDVVIIDDHPLVREGLRLVIDGKAGANVVGEAASIAEALALDVDEVDVITLDLAMPGVSGVDGIGDIRRKWPKARILVLTVHGEDTHAQVCAQRGAAGFLSKSATPDEIRAVVGRIAAGERHFSEAAANGADHVAFSARELEVLRMLATGLGVTEIAHTLGVSVKTVSTHKMRVQNKLGASSTAQILERARARGLLA